MMVEDEKGRVLEAAEATLIESLWGGKIRLIIVECSTNPSRGNQLDLMELKSRSRLLQQGNPHLEWIGSAYKNWLFYLTY